MSQWPIDPSMPTDPGGSTLLAFLYLAGALLACVLAVTWALLPFAVFGLKKRLTEIARIQELIALRSGVSVDDLPRNARRRSRTRSEWDEECRR
jgi:hypothetical protein